MLSVTGRPRGCAGCAWSPWGWRRVRGRRFFWLFLLPSYLNSPYHHFRQSLAKLLFEKQLPLCEKFDKGRIWKGFGFDQVLLFLINVCSLTIKTWVIVFPPKRINQIQLWFKTTCISFQAALIPSSNCDSWMAVHSFPVRNQKERWNTPCRA